MLTVNNRAGLRQLRGEKVEQAPAPAAPPSPPARDMGPMLAHMQAALHLQAENLTRTTELLAASMEPQAKKMTSIIRRDKDGRMVGIETTIERI